MCCHGAGSELCQQVTLGYLQRNPLQAFVAHAMSLATNVARTRAHNLSNERYADKDPMEGETTWEESVKRYFDEVCARRLYTSKDLCVRVACRLLASVYPCMPCQGAT